MATKFYNFCNDENEKNYARLIGLKRVHYHVTQMQSCYTSALSKFVCLDFLLWFLLYIINKQQYDFSCSLV